MNQAPSEEISVLIIDDEESMRDACTKVLEGEGYLVRTAGDGEKGLDMARESLPDIAFVDLNMPKLPGMALLDELNILAPDTVKVVITAYATVSSALEAVRHGAYDFLPKPFTPDELRATCRRALTRRRQVLREGRLDQEREQARRRFLKLVTSEVRGPLLSARTKLNELDPRLDDRPREQGIAREAADALDRLLDLVARWQQTL
jgi:DNA-binding NtrC family response regulator